MKKAKRAVVIGDVFVDMISEIEGFPERGGRTYGVPFGRSEGGTAGNIAAGLSALGMDTAIIAGIGEDEAGEFLLKGLEQIGVDVSWIRPKSGLHSGTTAIFTDLQGERDIYMLVRGSAFEKLETEDFACLEEIQPDILCLTGVLAGICPAQEAVVEAARKWKGKAELYFDPNLCYPADKVPPKVKEGTCQIADLCDVVLTGETEMKALGLTPKEGQSYVIKCGGQGSRLMNDRQEIVFQIPATRHRPVDTTGAGDTYMAAFVAARAQGKTMEDAMKYASVAAGISVTKKGARNMPSLSEIEKGIEEYK